MCVHEYMSVRAFDLDVSLVLHSFRKMQSNGVGPRTPCLTLHTPRKSTPSQGSACRLCAVQGLNQFDAPFPSMCKDEGGAPPSFLWVVLAWVFLFQELHSFPPRVMFLRRFQCSPPLTTGHSLCV